VPKNRLDPQVILKRDSLIRFSAPAVFFRESEQGVWCWSENLENHILGHPILFRGGLIARNTISVFLRESENRGGDAAMRFHR